MEAYKSERRDLTKQFLNHRLSLNECMVALDDALANLISRLSVGQTDRPSALISENNDMEVYKSETKELIRRFLAHRLSFPDCVAALDDALADLTSRLTGEQIAPLRVLILENNQIVMKEMERRGPPPFDRKTLAAFGDGITDSDYRPGQVIFAQGDSGDSVFYIQKGRVKLSVTSKFGKQAILGILGVGSFLGEGCLKGQPHAATATAIGKASLRRLDKSSMLRVLGENLAFSELFMDHLLSRNLVIEEDMVYQILNSHEKRLARALLMLADFGKKGGPKTAIPRITFEALAQMVGTTISRVSFFMKKFRRLGFIDYNGELKINNSLLNVILYDQFVTPPQTPGGER
jgi:CRP/FNR family transcriptional regulator, cyclic AMP receptor protein